jgi:drug/metabolite transporter (DMT)-like permease
VSTTAPSRSAAFGLTDLGLLLMATIWGINYSVVKFGMRFLTPLAYNGLRIVLAASALWAIWLALRGVEAPAPAVRWRLFVLGLVGNGLYQLCFIFGLSGTRVATASLIFASGPAFVALIGRARGVERIDRMGWVGIALQLVGVCCVVLSAAGDTTRVDTVRGIALILLGALGWAMYTVWLKPLTATTHPIYLSAMTMSSGALLLGLLAVPDLLALEWTAVPPMVWGAVVYSGLAALVVAYLLWYRGIQLLGPTRTAMYGNLQPVVAFVVAWIVLRETPTLWQWVGMVAILGGLAVSRREPPVARSGLAMPAPVRVHG